MIKANKISLEQGNVSGGLHDLKQVYKINYLEKEKNYSDKIELAILLKRDNNNEGAYRSLRFSSKVQLQAFILNLCKAYIYFSLKKVDPNNITPYLKLAHLNDLMNNISKEIKEMFRGK